VKLALQEKLQEMVFKENDFKKLVEDASVLASDDVHVAKRLHESYEELHDTITTLIRGRCDSFELCDACHKQLIEMTTQLDAAAAAVDELERDRDASLSHKLTLSEVDSVSFAAL